jgi:hypothetical protein
VQESDVLVQNDAQSGHYYYEQPAKDELWVLHADIDKDVQYAREHEEDH